MKHLKRHFILCALFMLSIMAYAGSTPLQEGDKAKMFSLKNAKGETVNLADLLKQGPVVLTWYRGGWCPYCNVALKSLSSQIDEFKKLGATLVAISPEIPDSSLSTKDKNDLQFEVLSDAGNKVAKTYGIVFKLDAETEKRYEDSFGLSNYNASTSGELPIPATYVINQNGDIEYAYVNSDYRRRVQPTTVINKLKEIKMKSNENKLVVVWTSDDPMVAERVALMYPHAAKKSKWFDEVTLVIWGPSAGMIATNKEVQAKVQAMMNDGVIVKACLACAEAYGVTNELKKLNYEVILMGTPLTDYLKKGYKVLTF
ncbi:MAG: redoxin domain-containing protein [Bacteroidales bacterium]